MAKKSDNGHSGHSAGALSFEAELYGQESSYPTWKLARMNLAIRDFSLSATNVQRVGVRCRFLRDADSFRADLHPDLKVDFVAVRKDLANPPFNMSDWSRRGGMRQEVRWKFGMEEKPREFTEKGSELYAKT